MMVASFPGCKVQEGHWKKWESIPPPTCHTLVPPSNGRLDGRSYSRVIRGTFQGQDLRPLDRLLKAESKRQHSYNHINKKVKSEKYFNIPEYPV